MRPIIAAVLGALAGVLLALAVLRVFEVRL